MLKGIPNTINGEMLKDLCNMGHGDLLAIVDANYPAVTMGRRVIDMPGITATKILDDILKIFPIDHVNSEPVQLMAVEQVDIDNGMSRPEIFDEFTYIVHKNYHNINIGECSRTDFYDKSKEAFVIIKTGEERLYGDILIYKGVVK